MRSGRCRHADGIECHGSYSRNQDGGWDTAAAHNTTRGVCRRDKAEPIVDPSNKKVGVHKAHRAAMEVEDKQPLKECVGMLHGLENRVMVVDSENGLVRSCGVGDRKGFGDGVDASNHGWKAVVNHASAALDQ